jgi:hypothetical protein
MRVVASRARPHAEQGVKVNPTTPARTAPPLAARLRAALAGTPGTLRVAGVIAASFAVIFGVLGSHAVAERSAGITQVRDEGAQIVRLQDVRTSLVTADAAATNAFLVGGLEPSNARESYERGVATATATLARAAAEANDAGTLSLAAVNRDIARYSGLVESARANNRQGFPVGVAYLKQASTLLRDDVLPTLQAITESSAGQVDDGADRSAGAMGLLLAAAVLGLGAALAAQVVLAVRTRRLISVPLAAGAGVVLGVALLASIGMAFAQWKANDVRNGAYARTVALSQARIEAFDAKSAESLTLISRGSGQAFEERFQVRAGSAVAALGGQEDSRAVGDRLAAYLEVHARVRELDDAGDWDAAVALATGPDEAGSNVTFASFDDVSRRALAEEADGLGDGLDQARAPLGVLRFLLLVAGVVAAALAWRGPSVRLREYR